MRSRTRLLISVFVVSGPLCPALLLAADPADPRAPVPPAPYASVTAGARSYRPVEPMPWGDVNRRVTPPSALPPGAKGAGQAPAPSAPTKTPQAQ